MAVELKRITPDNLDEILSLEVREDQKRFICSTAQALAQAYAYYETAYPFAIYADGKAVGFIMFGYYEARQQYTLWKFMIDKKYQGRGYGKAALLSGIGYMKEHHNIKELFTGVIPNNEVAKKLYQFVGFMNTGLFENGMEEMKLILKDDMLAKVSNLMTTT